MSAGSNATVSPSIPDLGDGGEGDVVAFQNSLHAQHRGAPVLAAFVQAQNPQAGFHGFGFDAPVRFEEGLRQFPELARGFVEDAGKEYVAGADLSGNRRLFLLRQRRQQVAEDGHADAEMPRFVFADEAERLGEHGNGGALVHPVKQRSCGEFPHQERGEQDRQGVFRHRRLEALPVARAVVVIPEDIVAREAAEQRLGPVAEGPAGGEDTDYPLADFLVVHFVANDGEKAFAHRVFAALFVGVDHRAGRTPPAPNCRTRRAARTSKRWHGVGRG